VITLALIGLVGGLVTGVSPCVLPLLPVIFFAGASGQESGADDTDRDDGAGGDGALATRTRKKVTTNRRRPLLIILGVVVSFSVVTLLGSVILSALGLPDSFLRWAGLTVLTVVGLGFIFPALGHVIEKPFYRLPKINNSGSAPFLFGLGLGTLYVPCAGPVLAAITVAGATGDLGVDIVVLTVGFAIGAALPLLFFATAGQRAAERIKAFRERQRTFRVIGGVVMIALAVALVFNVPAILQRAIPNYTGSIENRIAESDTVQGALAPSLNDQNKDLDKCTPGADELAECGKAPDIKGTQQWFNTENGEAVSLDDLQGKVVLIDFWAYSCINCQRDSPYIVKWYDTYKDLGLEVIGIHSPEFTFEKDAGNVQSAIDNEGIEYPVGQDNNLSTWTNYRNRYWPAKYLVDADGTVRAIKFGEGSYDTTESLIRELLLEADPDVDLPDPVSGGVKSPTPAKKGTTPETYLGYSRNETYSGPTEERLGRAVDYRFNDGQQKADTYGLDGTWTVETQYAQAGPGARSRISFSGEKVYHVLAGEGTVTVSVDGGKKKTIQVSGTPNLYEIYSGDDKRHTLTIEYSEGIQAYTWTFGQGQ
jgi:cytochrome c biogenesis protein CcdA/thiol-disulfide isomerase/thioredoxin